MKFDGYIRVSATKGRKGPSFISPEVQRDTIMRLAKTKGIKVEVVSDGTAKFDVPPATGVRGIM